jgi:hypothetical protein
VNLIEFYYCLSWQIDRLSYQSEKIMNTKNTTVVLWNEIDESQSESINGGLIIGNVALLSKLTDQSNNAFVFASGNAYGFVNSGGVAIGQVNNA